ncbi:cold-shock protein [Methylovirgula sp. 4M-Z18]|uniref:cold-shock protein n=1 Tax=Methylovirgula sp. 4M-Z18 TaxID=2293567 RepID=UPI000E2F0C6F|nr:cold shock domain-containing protein [Methylovirgula sp. 4M-Z18]RFB80541.1 cold shock domain-containing protein [Methylovirgula sp. 4M-Z18]
MSKGKDFRGPRKRGFDDDMPSPFDMPRPRPPRPAFGGGGFGGGPDMGGAPGKTVDATVKWFKGDKGFGFVELSDGTGDAFLHIGALQAAGYETVPPGSQLQVIVGQGQKGAQVTRVLSVDTSTAQPERPPRSGGGGGGGFDGPRPQRRAPDPSTAVDVSGTVKWFDQTKGFGFVASSDGGKDVFVHISVLGQSGIQGLAEGQPVHMRVVDTPKGREALALRLA